MNNKEFTNKLLDIATNYKTIYANGMFGQPITESIITQKTKQLPNWYTSKRQQELRTLVGQGYFGFDCICLIKGVLWGWNGSINSVNGGAVYESNGVQYVIVQKSDFTPMRSIINTLQNQFTISGIFLILLALIFASVMYKVITIIMAVVTILSK